jgi:hypothetical protein
MITTGIGFHDARINCEALALDEDLHQDRCGRGGWRPTLLARADEVIE